MVANTALFNLFLFSRFCNVLKFELQCKFLQKFDILQILKVLSCKEKVLLHRSILGGGTNIKNLCYYQVSCYTWHYPLCIQKIWLTLRYLFWPEVDPLASQGRRSPLFSLFKSNWAFLQWSTVNVTSYKKQAMNIT